MKKLLQNFGIIILTLVVLAGIMSMIHVGEEKPKDVGINTLVAYVQDDKVEKVEIEKDTILVTVKDISTVAEDERGKQLKIKKEFGQSFTELMENLGVPAEKIQGVDIRIKEDPAWKTVLLGIAPFLFPFLIIGVFLYFMTRQVQGANSKAMGFGMSTAKQAKNDEKSKKTFKDVAGAYEAKEELEEVVDFLKHPQKFTDMGAKIPRGVLLMGAPGTGKTLLAKAVAGEAEVPFFHISGSEFVEMFVGVGASRVRDLFSKAKKAAPAIVFIDEIDAVGRKRGAGLGGSHDEREQTLNQILVEMDGFDPNVGIIVIAATNRPDVLDKALLRPGRFDRRVVIALPDIKEREEILAVHVRNKPLAKEVSVKSLAERTPGFSGADLENLLNEAAILAVRKKSKTITEKMVRESIDKVLLGPEKKSRIMTEEDKEMTAYHEAGHAIVGHFLEHCDPVRKVSIIGRGMAGGYTLSMPEKDKHYRRLVEFKDDMAMMMGGYVAEEMQYGRDKLTTGPSSDLKKATQLAKKMVMQYGMSEELGPRVYGDNEELIFLAQEIHDKKNYSEKTAEIIDREINELLKNAKKEAERILTKHKDETERLVKKLLEVETVEQEEFNAIMEGKSLEKKEEKKDE
ncbi:MAG: ATP-dependent zinc metalloprotease FtsH [Candidatus Magasanikbacteria bacterium]|jgi:cell division protease FtsH|nr:ATP-dependent zinc metalloprotease FtsH [Candidatus Magasanikbacteria bacterium]MBT5262822.1 ATP-dependent zinc metalloprotease FtsH [Candidatus Magasanikbacteria bacterium]MBT5820068.1 ATP-dependent zinc metalloprotease FtsH [Candidatus Magasanikbacteria bacterium]MBT6294671.1 ATP-dependent zinc metalloprotease FtsH [Candidatus Magasanikbacteria bacterium]